MKFVQIAKGRVPNGYRGFEKRSRFIKRVYRSHAKPSHFTGFIIRPNNVPAPIFWACAKTGINEQWLYAFELRAIADEMDKIQ